jgi:hypothetical protein
MTEESTASLENLARKLRDDPRFIAYAMWIYQQREGLDGCALGLRLQTDSGMLTRLALCRRPDPNAPSVPEQLRELSNYTGINEALLTEVLAATGVEKAAELAPGRAPADRAPSDHDVAPMPGASARQTEWGRRGRAVLVAACLLVAVLAGLVFFVSQRQGVSQNEEAQPVGEQQTPEKQEAAQEVSRKNDEATPQPSPPPEDKTTLAAPERKPGQLSAANSVRIALGDHRALREGGASGVPGRIRLARALTALAVELQEGSRPGTYEVSVRGPFGEAVINQKAVSRDGRTLESNLDLRSLTGERYYLCIGRQGDIPDCLPMDVAPESRKTRR